MNLCSTILFHVILLSVLCTNVVTLAQTENTPSNPPRRILLIVVGAEGTPELGKSFQENATSWETAYSANQFEVRKIAAVGDSSVPNQREQLKTAIEEIATKKPAEFWLVLIGHGSFDGKVAKFNLTGPDVSAEETANWLDGLPDETTTVVINTAASSGGFLRPLAKNGRIVVTATKSGSEVNLTRFGLFLAKAVSDVKADLDKDGRTSLLEAFLSASKQTEDFYKGESRLATEHALIEDNGDGKGTAASWFTGWRVTGRAKDGTEPDGAKANQLFLQTNAIVESLSPEQLAERNGLELEIEALVRKKSKMAADDYYRELESLLLKLARLNAAAERLGQKNKD
jgi:hypothetical protein